MSEPDPRKDPRYRPFRAAAYGIYITVVVAFCLVVIVNVVRSVAAMTPGKQPAAEQVLTYQECLEGAEALWSQLEAERERLMRTAPTDDVDVQWMSFSTSWLERLRSLEARCALESRERSPLKTVFRRLDEVQDLYTLHAVQYAGEVGGAVDALRGAFSLARKSPAAGRLP